MVLELVPRRDVITYCIILRSTLCFCLSFVFFQRSSFLHKKTSSRVVFAHTHTQRVKEHREENTNTTHVGDFCAVQRLVFKNSSVEALPSLVENLPLLVRHARHFLLRTRSNPLGV